MTNNVCPNGNANAAFVHGLSDALHDGMDTFMAFSPCKCEACKARYDKGWDCDLDGEAVHILLARISELEKKLSELPVPSIYRRVDLLEKSFTVSGETLYHIYEGHCPAPDNPNDRDILCPACQKLIDMGVVA